MLFSALFFQCESPVLPPNRPIGFLRTPFPQPDPAREGGPERGAVRELVLTSSALRGE